MPPEDPGAALSRQWLLRPQRDLKTADRLAADADLAGMVTFHCQQAAEKALKGYLASRNQPFRRTHDLRELLGQCLVLDADFSTLQGAGNVLDGYLMAG